MPDEVISTATSEAPAATPPAPVETPSAPPTPEPAPVAAPAAPAAPVAPAPAPVAPQTRREARAQVAKQYANREVPKAAEPEPAAPEAPAAAPEVRTDEQPPVVPTPPAEAAKPPATPAVPAAAPAAPKPPEPAAPSLVRIEVPEGHPLRARFKDFVARTPEEEQGIRALMNGYVRTKENEQLRAQLAELQRKQAFVDATAAAQEAWQKTPEYQAHVATYNELLAERGKEIADRYWQGAQGDLQALRDGEYQARVEEIEASETQQRAEEWTSEAWENAARIPESIRKLPQFREWFDDEVQALDAALQRGRVPSVMDVPGPERNEALHKEFMKRFAARITREPAATAVLNAATQRTEAERAAAAAKAAEDTRRLEQVRKEAAEKAVAEFKAQAAATRAQATPLGNLVPASRSVPASPSEAPADATPPQGLSANAIRKQAREAVRQRYAAGLLQR